MRNTILLITLFVLALPVHGQDLPDYSERKNEINIGYFNAFDLNGIDDLGVGYKRMINNSAIRIGTGFHFMTNTHESVSSQDSGSFFEVSPRLGYEFYQWFNRIRLNFGVDLVGTYYKSKSDYSSDNPDSFVDYTTTSIQYGVRPLMGLTVYINKLISISTETYLDIRYYKNTDENIRWNGTITTTDKGMTTGLGPLGIVSINFHF
ncbi:MAG: hypothetical protein ABFS38_08955 [Bacteroidota bacterium]